MSDSTPGRQGLVLWFLQRVTGVMLIVGIGVHFFVGHYTGTLTAEGVMKRLAEPGWLVFDLLLIVLLAFHALTGLRNVLLDYNPRATRALTIGALVLMALFVAYCARDLLAFHAG